MNLSNFGSQNLINGHVQYYSKTEEAKRLADELRSRPARWIKRCHICPPVYIKAHKGFDIETCQLSDIIDYIRTHPKISQSKLTFLYRIVAVRFPMDYRIISKIERLSPLETDMIGSNATNDLAWFGETGFQNCVRLDKSLTIDGLKVVKRKNDQIRVVRK